MNLGYHIMTLLDWDERQIRKNSSIDGEYSYYETETYHNGHLYHNAICKNIIFKGSFELNDNSNMFFENCQFNNESKAIFKNRNFEHNGLRAFDTGSSSKSTFNNCHFKNVYLKVSDSSHVEAKDCVFLIDAPHKTSRPSIDVLNSASLKLTNCSIGNVSGDNGVVVSKLASVEIQDCTFSKFSKPSIALYEQGKAIIRTSTFDDMTSNVAVLRSGSRAEFIGCKITRSVNYPSIFVENEQTSCLIRDTVIKDCPITAVYVKDNANVELDGVEIANCSSYGIYLEGRSHAKVSNTKISRISGNAIYIAGGSQLKASGLTIDRTTNIALIATDPTTRIEMTEAHFRDIPHTILGIQNNAELVLRKGEFSHCGNENAPTIMLTNNASGFIEKSDFLYLSLGAVGVQSSRGVINGCSFKAAGKAAITAQYSGAAVYVGNCTFKDSPQGTAILALPHTVVKVDSCVLDNMNHPAIFATEPGNTVLNITNTPP